MAPIFKDGEFGLVIDYSARDARLQLAQYMFERGKAFIEEGGKIEIPIFAIVGTKPIEGRPETQGSIIVIDQDDYHVRMYRQDKDRYHMAMGVKASRIGAFMLVKMEVSLNIPEEDEEAWGDRDYREHPKHWETLEVVLISEQEPNDVLHMYGKIEYTGGCTSINEAEAAVRNLEEEDNIPGFVTHHVHSEFTQQATSPTFGNEFKLPPGTDVSDPASRFAFANGLFAKTKEYIDGGGTIYIPLFAIIGRILTNGEPNLTNAILVVDQTAKNMSAFQRSQDEYNGRVMGLAASLGAYQVARIAECCCVPAQDAEAWKGKHHGGHPDHWHEIQIEVQSETNPSEIVLLISKITVGATCRFVEEPAITVIQKPSHPPDKNLQ